MQGHATFVGALFPLSYLRQRLAAMTDALHVPPFCRDVQQRMMPEFTAMVDGEDEQVDKVGLHLVCYEWRPVGVHDFGHPKDVQLG